jgi:hypothetical protein
MPRKKVSEDTLKYCTVHMRKKGIIFKICKLKHSLMHVSKNKNKTSGSSCLFFGI